MGQLGKEHAHNVTPCAEGSCHGIHTGLPRKFRDQMLRNQIAKLPEYTEFRCGWFGISFFHLCCVAVLKSHANHFFCALAKTPMGWLCIRTNENLDGT